MCLSCEGLSLEPCSCWVDDVVLWSAPVFDVDLGAVELSLFPL